MFDAPEVGRHTPEAKYSDSITKYVIVYIGILALAGLQFLIAYQHTTGMGTLARMLPIAIVQAGIAIMFFMHLWAEKRAFVLFIILVTGFVMLTLQDSWTDSYRVRHGVPGAQINSGTNP